MFSRYLCQFSKTTLKNNFSTKTKSIIQHNLKGGINKNIYLPATMVGCFVFYSFSKRFNTTFSAQETIRHKLEGFINMNDGEMRPYKYGKKDEETILIVKYNGKFHALSNSCPHFGAPLDQGILVDNIIKCPWHGASFNVETGLTDLYPSLDSLVKFEIVESNGELEVLLPKNMKNKKVNSMAKRDPNDNKVYVIVGGGPAALACAENLRQMDYTGRIVIVTEENFDPYDRTHLSKWMVPNIDKIVLRNESFLREYDIEVLRNMKVTSIDTKEKKIRMDKVSGEKSDNIYYDKCLLATGASPITPKIPGVDYKGVYTMRSWSDFENIRSGLKDAKNIVIIGSGFIGMESASNLKKANKNANVTVVDMIEYPFERILGKEIGKALQKLHTDNGINFIMKSSLKEVKSNGDKVVGVQLNDGTVLDADILIFGTGVSPRTEMLSNSNITLDNRSVKCNAFLQTSDENVFAAGDCCSFPYPGTGERIYFAHYTLAQQQGAVAAMNMLGQKIPFDYLPYFWTRAWDKGLQYVSSNNGSFDEVFIDGNLHDLVFCAYYLKNNKVVSFAAMNVPNAVNIVYEAMRNNVMPNGTAIKSGKANIDTIRNNLKGVKVKCSRVNCICAAKRNNNL